MKTKKIINKNKHLSWILLLVLVCAIGCQPDRVNEMSLSGNPETPGISVEFVADNPNRVVVTVTSQDFFQYLWDTPGGTPKTSAKISDTIQYAKAGDYTITLYASAKDGSGTGFVSRNITILQDAALGCSPKLALLTGDCQPEGKCWTLTREAGAVKVGPTYDDFSWFTSPKDGLQDAQYDDRFCFIFADLVFQNRNNGSTVNPWDGYQAQSVDFGISDFNFVEGAGINGRDQIILQNDQFMGVWDSDNVLDIVKLTEQELIVRTRLSNQAGEPAAEGWFELTFVAN